MTSSHLVSFSFSEENFYECSKRINQEAENDLFMKNLIYIKIIYTYAHDSFTYIFLYIYIYSYYIYTY